MLSGNIRILNFDDSIMGQKKLAALKNSHVIDLRELGPSCRSWTDEATARKITDALNPGEKNEITFLGSGDFHHVSSILTGQFQEDFSVVIFDLHPDLDMLPPRFSCGSWVNRVAKQKNVKKIVMLGPSSEDLDFPNNMTFDFSWFRDGRVELYPFFHEPSYMLGKGLRKNNFIDVKGPFFFQKIFWTCLRGLDMASFMEGIIRRLPTGKIYISVDKDCLTWDKSVTNWEEGVMDLDMLLTALTILKNHREIIGLDITGDYSPMKFGSFIKRIISRHDHPEQKAEKMGSDMINAVNETTNLKILDLFL